MDFDHKSFPEAVESLAADIGMTVPREERSPQAAARQSEHDRLLAALTQADLYYQAQLRQHPARERAVNYLKKRGLTGQIAKRFGIGLAPPGWENLLQHLEQYKISRDTMERAGLIIAREADKRKTDVDSHYDRFRDRIMFPIRDTRGRVIAFGGRVLGDDKPKYLNSPETPVYHKGQELYGLYEARQSRRKLERMLIVEGYMDVVALAQHGIDFAVATLGTATSSTHLTRLFRLVPEVIFCFDGDDAGRAAAWRALQNALPLMTDGRQIRLLFLPDGEDPDTLVRKEGAEAFLRRMTGADTLSAYFFDHLLQDIDSSSMDGKAKLFSTSLPLLKTLPRGLFQQLMLDELARLTNSQRDTIDRLMLDTEPARTEAASTPPPPVWDTPPATASVPPAEAAPAANRVRKSAAMIAVELLLHQPDLANHAGIDLDSLRELHTPDIDLLLDLLEFCRSQPHVNTYALLGHCYGTAPGKRLTQLLKAEKITPESGRADEFAFVINRLQSEARQQRLRQQLLKELQSHARSAKNDTE